MAPNIYLLNALASQSSVPCTSLKEPLMDRVDAHEHIPGEDKTPLAVSSPKHEGHLRRAPSVGEAASNLG